MNWFDLLIVVLILFCILRGFMRGLAKEITSLIGLILAAWLGFRGIAAVTPLAAQFTNNEVLKAVICFVIIFVVVWILFILLGYILQRTLRFFRLTGVDRFLGGIVGIVKGVLLSLIIFTLLTVFMSSTSGVLSTSRVAPYLTDGSRFVRSLMPASLTGIFDVQMKNLEAIWSGGDEALSQILRENERVQETEHMRR